MGFKLGRYDRRLPLVIDPVLSYSTLLGGSGSELAMGLAVDGVGNAYIVGDTNSIDFPLPMPGQIQDARAGEGLDAFIAKLNPEGTGFVYATYLGGIGTDRAVSVTFDTTGNAYVTGDTSSPDFPGSALPSIAGRVMRPDGTGIGGVTVELSGAQMATTITAANGFYQFPELQPSMDYLVKPILPLTAIQPREYLFQSSNFSSDVTADFTISACTYSLASSDKSFAAGAGGGEVALTSSDPECQWTAVSNAPWLNVAGAGSGHGNANIFYNVEANSAPMPRSAILIIAGQTFTVLQGASFSDVGESHLFYNEIGKLSSRGVTLGCGEGIYCPEAGVTREQMAAFLIRALGEFNPPIPSNQRFADVTLAPPFAPFIEELAQRGITLGCGVNEMGEPIYCPTGIVTREQAAAFIMRALGEFSPPLPSVQRFLDVPPQNIFYHFIDRIAVRGITLGCGDGNYCPESPLTRGQMAALLVRAFGW